MDITVIPYPKGQPKLESCVPDFPHWGKEGRGERALISFHFLPAKKKMPLAQIMPPAKRRRVASERGCVNSRQSISQPISSLTEQNARKIVRVATWGGENRRGAEERRRADEDFARLGENDQHY